MTTNGDAGDSLPARTPPALPDREPNLTREEWDRRFREPSGMTTAEVLNLLRGLEPPPEELDRREAEESYTTAEVVAYLRGL